jgi:hypothetical protein
MNSFVLELYSLGGFPLEVVSEIFSQYTKGIIFWINYVIVLTVSLFLLIIVIIIGFFLYIFPFGIIQVVSKTFPLHIF